MNKQSRVLLGLILLIPYLLFSLGDSKFSFKDSPSDVYTIELDDFWSLGNCYSTSYSITNLSDVDPTPTTHYFYQDNSSNPVLTYQDPETIPPGGTKIYDPATIPNLPTNFHGYVIVAAAQPISGEILPFPPCDITLTVQSSGVVGTEYTLTADVTPENAALPITYTWVVTDFLPIVNTGGITDTIKLSWPSSGWKQIWVNAENSRGSAQINGLLFIMDPPRVYLPIILERPITNPPVITGDVIIADIFYDGAGTSEPDEYVEIQNVDYELIQLKGWILHDIENHVFTFPDFVIKPGQICRIYTNEIHSETCEFSYASEAAIWNNDGDTAYLRDAYGTLIDEYSY